MQAVGSASSSGCPGPQQVDEHLAVDVPSVVEGEQEQERPGQRTQRRQRERPAPSTSIPNGPGTGSRRRPGPGPTAADVRSRPAERSRPPDQAGSPRQGPRPLGRVPRRPVVRAAGRECADDLGPRREHRRIQRSARRSVARSSHRVRRRVAAQAPARHRARQRAGPRPTRPRSARTPRRATRTTPPRHGSPLVTSRTAAWTPRASRASHGCSSTSAVRMICSRVATESPSPPVAISATTRARSA